MENADKPVKVRMIREDLEGLPRHELPGPYRIRRYQPGDEESWLAIHLRADQRLVYTPETFPREFGTDLEAIRRRQFYLCDGDGTPIGTASAWYNKRWRGRSWGVVHWIAIVPEGQGKGLGKALLSAVCRRMRELRHVRAYLITDTSRLPAICMYLKFGFVPEIEGDADRAAWPALRERLPEELRARVPSGRP
jgi:GNAT superfamily N-acetyltransferase